MHSFFRVCGFGMDAVRCYQMGGLYVLAKSL